MHGITSSFLLVLRTPLPNARLGKRLQRALSPGGGERNLVLGLLAALHFGFVDGFAVDVFAFGTGGGGGVDVHVCVKKKRWVSGGGVDVWVRREV